ncbi:transporter [Candidatus Saccharibacteria bacterium]|nr:transporter [Candidatus Saccharibacteria bacterium]MBH1973261.1 transporter [Candidatus Saccharibacteria bacterium]MBH1990498.1 transporter [Candidatus Saccharibacteria bacterium]
MSLFKVSNNNASRLKPITNLNGKRILERDVQRIFEASLHELLGVHFLASEYSTSFGGRMDTLGIDDEGNPCIIEYKKGQNENVINQGLSYLRWLLDHKDSFEKLCNEKNISIATQWSAPRVICVAESYNKFDTDTADLLPIKIELYRYKLYEEGLLTLDTENHQKVKLQDAPKFTADSEKSEKLQETFTLDHHLVMASEETKALFEALKERILAIDKDIIEDPKKLYLAYKTTRNFVDIVFKKSKLKLYINMKTGMLDDPRGLARDLETPVHIGHWGNGDYLVEVSEHTDIDYVMELIHQSYDINQ